MLPGGVEPPLASHEVQQLDGQGLKAVAPWFSVSPRRERRGWRAGRGLGTAYPFREESLIGFSYVRWAPAPAATVAPPLRLMRLLDEIEAEVAVMLARMHRCPACAHSGGCVGLGVDPRTEPARQSAPGWRRTAGL